MMMALVHDAYDDGDGDDGDSDDDDDDDGDLFGLEEVSSN